MPPVLPPDPPLTDGELTLRWRRPEDGPALVRILQDPVISRWTRVPVGYDEGDFAAFLVRSEAERLDGDGLSLLVVDAVGDIVGSVALHEIRTPRPDIGYWVAPEARGRSVAPRAVGLLRDWAHARLGLDRIEIHVHPDNASSLRAAQKAGFEPTGRMRPSRRDTAQQLMVLTWRAPRGDAPDRLSPGP